MKMRMLLRCGLAALMAGGSGIGHAAGDHTHAAAPAKVDRAQMWQAALARAPIAVAVAFDARGHLWLARVEAGHVLVSRSTDLGKTFSAPVKVNAEPELIAADGENRPKLAFGRQGEIYVSWTQSLEVPFAGHVRFSRSLDGGQRFSAPITVNDNREAISHRFDALMVDGAGRVRLVWLDRRDKTAADKACGAPAGKTAADAGRPQTAECQFAGISLYSAVSEDQGASFATNRRLANHSCECCRIAHALDADGAPVIAWRHVFGRNVRDHAWQRLDGRATMQRLSHEQWAMDACPHHGPTLSITRDGVYHAAWYSGAEQQRGLFYARSDGASGFRKPLPFGDNDAQAGHPSVLGLGARVELAWKEFDGKQTVIRAMCSRDGGDSWDAPRTLATTTERSDHPQLLAHDGRAFLAWNTAREGLRLIELSEK